MCLTRPATVASREVEAVEVGVAALEFGDDAQRVAVVVEAAVGRHAGVERVLAGVAERRVAEVVAERDRLGEVVVEPQGPRERAGDLRHLDRVGEAGAEMVALVMDEHLRLVGEAAEGGRMDDAVAVALEFVRVGDGGSATSRRAPRRIGRIGRAGPGPVVVRHSAPRRCAFGQAAYLNVSNVLKRPP